MNISALRRGAVTSAVLGLTLAACGSSASSSTSSTTATTSSGNAAAVAAAASYVQSLEQRPTTFSVPSLPSKPPTGKSIDFMA